jgi:adenosylhomocysteine nucleosidase
MYDRQAMTSKHLPPIVLLCLSLLVHLGAQQQQPATPVIAVMAVPQELPPIVAHIEAPVVQQFHGVMFTAGTLGKTRVVAVRSGVGKVNAAMAAMLLIERFAPAAIIFSGTAGALDLDLRPGDVVIATAMAHHDFGAFTEKAFIRRPTRNPGSGELDPILFPMDPRLLDAARRAAKATTLSPLAGREQEPAPAMHEGSIVTGDAFVANPALRTDLRATFNARAVEMEGAAVALVCARAGVPLLVIRSITDRADGEAGGNYQRYVEGASRNAAALALATIREFVKAGTK